MGVLHESAVSALRTAMGVAAPIPKICHICPALTAAPQDCSNFPFHRDFLSANLLVLSKRSACIGS